MACCSVEVRFFEDLKLQFVLRDVSGQDLLQRKLVLRPTAFACRPGAYEYQMLRITKYLQTGFSWSGDASHARVVQCGTPHMSPVGTTQVGASMPAMSQGSGTNWANSSDTSPSDTAWQNHMRSDRVRSAVLDRFTGYDYRIQCEAKSTTSTDPVRVHLRALRLHPAA